MGTTLTDASLRLTEALACHTAACRPPSSGGSGGSLRQHALPDVAPGDVRFAYRPRHPDGHADPGEIVWAHVPFEDNPSQGKDRPVLIVGRTESGNLVGVQLSTKGHHKGSFPIEWGTDRESYLRPERFIQVDATNYRKEGAYVRKPKFQEIVDTISKQHGLTMQVFVSHVESFACHDASCRPPTSGGTGGSSRRHSSVGFGGQSLPRTDRVQPKRLITALDKRTMDALDIGDPDLPTKKRSEAFIASWYKPDNLPEGYSVDVKAQQIGTNYFSVNGVVKNQFGRRVGDFERTIEFDPITAFEDPKLKNQWGGQERSFIDGAVVSHDSFHLDGDAQGKGIGEALNAKAVESYQKYGIDHVKVNAGHEVGGYAWAVAGFRIDDGQRSHAMAAKDYGIDRHEYATYFASKGSDTITRLQDNAELTVPQAKAVQKELEALTAASARGEDVQPIHFASIGEKDMRFKKKTAAGEEYETWPGKEIMLGTTWPGTYYFGEPLTASGVEEFYSPTQPRDKEGQWTAHRAGLTSLSRDSLDRAMSNGVRGIFGEIGLTGTTPWPSAPRSKKGPRYDKALVDEALRKPPVLEKVDPRILYATQNGLVRTHVNYYMGDEYKRTGKTAADQTNSANAFPVVYVTRDGKHIILTGHHRSAAALIKGEDLDAIVVREP